jgi:hypothetical protein
MRRRYERFKVFRAIGIPDAAFEVLDDLSHGLIRIQALFSGQGHQFLPMSMGYDVEILLHCHPFYCRLCSLWDQNP